MSGEQPASGQHGCDSCRFHDRQAVAGPNGEPIIGETQMICRRMPPTVAVIQIPTQQGMQVQMVPAFPGVNADIWCYEYEPENGAQDLYDQSGEKEY